MTLGEILDGYLLHAERQRDAGEISAGTLTHYRVNAAAIDVLRLAPADEVSRPLIVRWHRAISADPHPRTGRPMRRRANAALDVLRRALSWACDEGLLERNPAEGIRRNSEPPRERYLLEDEIVRFVRALRVVEEWIESPEGRGGGYRAAAIDALRLLLMTGCRRREICALTWDQVRVERGAWLDLRRAKGGPRVVPIARGALAVIERRRSITPPGVEWVLPADDLRGPVDYLHRVWGRVLAAADLEGSGVCIHTLRHTWACQALLAGERLEDVSLVLGHKSVRVTQRSYAHVLWTPAARDTAHRVGERIAAVVG